MKRTTTEYWKLDVVEPLLNVGWECFIDWNRYILDWNKCNSVLFYFRSVHWFPLQRRDVHTQLFQIMSDSWKPCPTFFLWYSISKPLKQRMPNFWDWNTTAISGTLGRSQSYSLRKSILGNLPVKYLQTAGVSRTKKQRLVGLEGLKTQDIVAVSTMRTPLKKVSTRPQSWQTMELRNPKMRDVVSMD